MTVSLAAMTRQWSDEVATWRYDAPYEVYNGNETSSAALLDGNHLAILDDGRFIGYVATGLEARVRASRPSLDRLSSSYNRAFSYCLVRSWSTDTIAIGSSRSLRRSRPACSRRFCSSRSSIAARSAGKSIYTCAAGSSAMLYCWRSPRRSPPEYILRGAVHPRRSRPPCVKIE